MPLRSAALVSLILLLAACASSPPPRKTAERPLPAVKPQVDPEAGKRAGGYYLDDGPAPAPVDIAKIPEPVPVEEPELPRANQPYTVQGEVVTPERGRKAYSANGIASWYGKRFHGRKTASGERFDMFAFSAAHRTLPIPSYARVTNTRNGKSVIVRVNDRGPFHKRRLIDLSYAAAVKLDFVSKGEAPVLIERVLPGEAKTHDDTLARRAEDAALETDKVYLQLGSFRKESSARALIERLRPLLKDTELRLQPGGGYFRVLAGPYDNDARALAAKDGLPDTVKAPLLYRPSAAVSKL